ncbi:MAG: plasmid mobilization relaxosome protein MobC [Bacteroidota bacterium]
MAEDPKRKGRPLLTGGKRTFKIDVRFTEDEYKLILEMEQALGISRTNLVRQRLLKNGDGIIINTKALILELNQIGAELGRSGNNLNQLAHYSNVLNLKEILSPVVVERYLLLLDENLKSRSKLDATLRKIIRQLGN